MNRRLNRCRHDRLIAGVASGVAEYFDVDPTIVRLLWIASVFFGGVGLLVYVVMAIIVPLEAEEAPGVGTPAGDPTGEATVAASTAASAPATASWHGAPAAHQHHSRGSGRVLTFLGIALVLFGSLAIVDIFLPASVDGGRFLWPAFILGIGALLVISAVRREPTEL